ATCFAANTIMLPELRRTIRPSGAFSTTASAPALVSMRDPSARVLMVLVGALGVALVGEGSTTFTAFRTFSSGVFQMLGDNATTKAAATAAQMTATLHGILHARIGSSTCRWLVG